jgi:hypothetical protein
MAAKDKALPENAKADAKLNQPAGTIRPSATSSGSPEQGAATQNRRNQAASRAQGGSDQEGPGPAADLLAQAKETIGEVADSASEAAREAYDQGRRYARAARERYPEAERYYRTGVMTVRQHASENPLLTLLFGIGIGYALAWAIQSSGRSRHERVPDYARTGRGYAPHVPQPRA